MGRTLAIFLSCIALAATQAQAGTLALDIFENTGNTGTSGTQSLGWQFQVNLAILVDGLGFFDHTDTQGHDVGIFNDSTHALLFSTTVQPTDPVMGTAPWRVHTIAPVLLSPGTYDIAAETGANNYTFNPNSKSTAPEITYLQDRFLFGSAVLAYPSSTSGVVGWFGPTFTFTDAGGGVPEPATMGLLGAGLFGLAAIARLRR